MEWGGACRSFFCIVLLYLSVPHFWAPSPEPFKHSKSLGSLAWARFRLSKNRFRLRTFRPQKLPVSPPPKALLNAPILAASRVLSDLQKYIYDHQGIFRLPKIFSSPSGPVNASENMAFRRPFETSKCLLDSGPFQISTRSSRDTQSRATP